MMVSVHSIRVSVHSLPQRVKIELIFALRATVSEIRAVFENYHIWA